MKRISFENTVSFALIALFVGALFIQAPELLSSGERENDPVFVNNAVLTNVAESVPVNDENNVFAAIESFADIAPAAGTDMPSDILREEMMNAAEEKVQFINE